MFLLQIKSINRFKFCWKNIKKKSSCFINICIIKYKFNNTYEIGAEKQDNSSVDGSSIMSQSTNYTKDIKEEEKNKMEDKELNLGDQIKAGEIYLGYDLNTLNLDSENSLFLSYVSFFDKNNLFFLINIPILFIFNK